MPGTREIGARWEESAAALLAARGLDIIARQYACRLGEIDLIAADAGTLVFIEVRYRGSGSFGGAAASVTPAKQRRIVQAARHFIMTHPDFAQWPMRMDVVAIQGDEPGGASLDWIRDAFAAG